jgi:hypothetical protein
MEEPKKTKSGSIGPDVIFLQSPIYAHDSYNHGRGRENSVTFLFSSQLFIKSTAGWQAHVLLNAEQYCLCLNGELWEEEVYVTSLLASSYTGKKAKCSTFTRLSTDSTSTSCMECEARQYVVKAQVQAQRLMSMPCTHMTKDRQGCSSMCLIIIGNYPDQIKQVLRWVWSYSQFLSEDWGEIGDQWHQPKADDICSAHPW